MLILTRRVGETVMIGNDVTVTVLGVKGNQVRIGINAPKNVAVHREEIFERIKREQQGEAGRPARPSPPPSSSPSELIFNGCARRPRLALLHSSVRSRQPSRERPVRAYLLPAA